MHQGSNQSRKRCLKWEDLDEESYHKNLSFHVLVNGRAYVRIGFMMYSRSFQHNKEEEWFCEVANKRLWNQLSVYYAVLSGPNAVSSCTRMIGL